MRRFRGFIIKEFYHIFRDYRTMIILFGMPIVQVLLFGFVITNDIKNADIAVWDKSKDNVTTKITNKLLSSGYFRLNGTVGSYAEAEEAFKKGKVKEIVVFESDFAGKLERENTANMQILADASDPNTANLLINYTQNIISDYTRERNVTKSGAIQVTPEIKMRYNPEMKSVYMFVPGVITIILMLISSMMTSISIAREKELGTMEVLLASPLKPIQIIIGKVVPYITLAFGIAIVVLLMGRYIFDVPITGSIVLLLSETLLFILLALSLGILVSTLTNTQQTAMMISLFILLLPTILLSGFIFPIENMPLPLQVISNILPARWFIIILKDIMLKGSSFIYIWKETLILVGTTLFFIALSIVKFKKRLE